LCAALCANHVELNTNASDLSLLNPMGSTATLAELGSLQMEFATLSWETGDPKYARLADSMIERVDAAFPTTVIPLIKVFRCLICRYCKDFQGVGSVGRSESIDLIPLGATPS